MMDAVDDLVVWLHAQLDEDERMAKAATPGRWVPGHWALHMPPDIVHAPDYRPPGFSQGQNVAETIVAEGGMGPWCASLRGSGFPAGNAAHIAEHDPARVLAEVDAKRLLLDLHKQCEASCYILRVLALPYSDRPGYQEAWRP